MFLLCIHNGNLRAKHLIYIIQVQAEIDDVIARSRQPSMSDSPNMPYTNAVMLEVQRMRPVAPTALPHYTREQTKLGDNTIPKHTST